MTQARKEVEVGTLLLGNEKNNVIVNYLFINLVFLLKLSRLNDYLKGSLKSKTNKLPRKNKYQFSVRRCRFIKDISLLSFLIQHIYISPKLILDELFGIWHKRYQPMQLYLWAGFSWPTQASFFLICMGDSAGMGYRLHVMARPVYAFMMSANKKCSQGCAAQDGQKEMSCRSIFILQFHIWFKLSG